MEKLKYPNFLLIGAGKSGTTSIYDYLKQHPDVYLTPTKETNFFAVEGQTPVDPKDDPEGFFYYPWAIYNLDDYKKQYDGIKNEKIAGEVCPAYLYKPNTHTNIKRYVPDVKLIAIFRNPADRLFSRWLHLVRDNRKPTDTFEEVFNKDSIWWKRDDLVQEGFYFTHLKKYFEIFDKDKIKVYLMEDMKNDTKAFIKDLYQYLEIDDSFEPVTDISFNVSGIPKNKMADKLYGTNSVIGKSMKMISPKFYNNLKNSNNLKRMINKLRKKNMDKPKLSLENRKKLINEIYKDEILQLQDLINRDLRHWIP